MSRIALVFGAVLAVLPAQAFAQSAHLCTGLGEDERQEAAVFPHTLKLVFAEVSGSYVGAVAVTISRGSSVVFQETCDGPWLLLNLDSGAYKVTAVFEEQTKEATVKVGTRPSEKTIAFKSAR